MSNIVLKQVSMLATKFNLDVDPRELVDVLKATAFKGSVSDAQMSALMVVANQYGLNPFTREIYAFPDRNNGIVPVVGVDGWARIINEHPAFDGMEFDQNDEACTCIMFRKDRSHAIKVTEYLSECRRDNAPPWKSHPKRMLRHKALIQCARLAFGFVGIYDEDEAERIRDMGAAEVVGSRPLNSAPAEVILPNYSEDQLAQNLPAWQKAADEGKFNADNMVAKISTRYALSPAQQAVIRSITPRASDPQPANDMAEHADFVTEMEGTE